MKQWFSSHCTWGNEGAGFLRQVTNAGSPAIAHPAAQESADHRTRSNPRRAQRTPRVEGLKLKVQGEEGG